MVRTVFNVARWAAGVTKTRPSVRNWVVLSACVAGFRHVVRVAGGAVAERVGEVAAAAVEGELRRRHAARRDVDRDDGEPAEHVARIRNAGVVRVADPR
jgi:hypothetical protein